MKVASKLLDSLSGLYNSLSGLGGLRDKGSLGTWNFLPLNDQQLDCIFRQSWMARKAVTIPAFDILIAGDTEVEVSSTLPILSAIAHLIVGTGGASDRIDLRSDQRINERQIARAIEYWSTDMAVPLTAGEIINLPMLERLDAYYDVCMPVDEPLPLSIDPDFIAFRSIETFLPCDSVDSVDLSSVCS